jgi:cold shock protein
MSTGKVKWWRDELGYGFIVPDDGSIDVFCHYSSIQMEGRRNLVNGAAVEFDTEQYTKGVKAVNVRLRES